MGTAMHRGPRLGVLLAVCLLTSGLLLTRLPAGERAQAASITVDTLADLTGAGCPVGACSLRRAIGAAASGDTITFSVTGPITLTNGVLLINKNLTITGPGPSPSSLIVNGNNATQVFDIGTTTPSTVTLSGLTIQ